MRITRHRDIPPAPGSLEGRWSTPGEWVDWFLGLSREHQEIVAETRIEDGQEALRCFMQHRDPPAPAPIPIAEIAAEIDANSDDVARRRR